MTTRSALARLLSTLSATAKATFYAVKGPNGDLTWRVESPAFAVGAKVHYIPDGHDGGEALYWPNEGDAFPWQFEIVLDDGTRETVASRDRWEQLCRQGGRLADVTPRYPTHEGGSAVFTRPLAFGAAHMLGLKQNGVRVVAEVDDNYLSDQHLNWFMQQADKDLRQTGKSWEDYRDDHARSICTADAIIVSTDHLRDVYWRELARLYGKKDLPDILVCRNHVDERFVPKTLVPPREDGKLRVGYMGSDSHVWDVDLIYEACVEAFVNGHEIVFVGINPAAINPKYRKSRKDWGRISYTHVPWTNDYRGTALPLDIGFCPLRVDSHTLCKSDIKWLEYGLSGAATVAQNCLVYNRTAVHGENALMANSPAEFVVQMRRLINEPGLRERLVTGTREYIEEERLLSKNTDEWRQAVYG